MRRFAPQLFAQLFCSLILFAFCDCAGQSPFPVKAQQQADNRLRALERLRSQPSPSFEREKRLAEISLKNDFRHLQIVHNQLMARMFERPAGKKPTTSEIRSSLGEIQKLAERLRSSFAFPKVKLTEPTTQIGLASGLLQLDQAIMSFVENPLFQQTRVYDVELASRAGKDIGEVLRLVNELRNLTKKH